jgi:hypothetical protein
MKIRNGFVSNSSSSSFIIAVPADSKIEDVIKENFSIPKEHPLHHLGENAITQLKRAIQDSTKIESWEQFVQEYGMYLSDDEDDEAEISTKAKEAFNRNFKVYFGDLENDYGELNLAGDGIDINNDKLIFYSEAGY